MLEDSARLGPRYRVPWAELLRKVFSLDVLACLECGVRMELIAFIVEARVLRRALVALQRQRGNPSFGKCRTCRHFPGEGADTFRCGLTGEPLLWAEIRQTCREHAWPGGVPDPA